MHSMSFVDFSICENAHAYAIHVFNSQSLQVSIFFVFIPFLQKRLLSSSLGGTPTTTRTRGGEEKWKSSILIATEWKSSIQITPQKYAKTNIPSQ